MTRITSIMLTVTLLAATAGGLGARAQNPGARDKNSGAAAWREFAQRLHPQARVGSTPERRAAWERLTPAERQALGERFRQIVEGAAEKARKEGKGRGDGEPADVTVSVVDGAGNQRPLKAKAGKKWSALLPAETGRARAPRAGAEGRGPRFVRAAFGAAAAPQSGCWKGIEQFVRDFHVGGLGRQPSPFELNDWVGRLTYTQAQGMEQLWVEGRALGYAVFKSGEYAARARSDADFVSDLYRGFLQREPDANGHASWMAALQNGYSRDHVIDGFGYSTEFWVYRIQALCNAATADSDFDGLTDLFEVRVADAFTPFYHVSAGDPDHFSTFADRPDQVVAQRFGQNPISHFRVKPFGFAIDAATGQPVSVVRVDYLTLLDHDSGLVGGFFCNGIGSFGIPLGGLGAHPIDNERSAALLGAPVSGSGYNPDPAAYRGYEYVTVAHEDVDFFEQRTYISVFGGLPPNEHFRFYLSRSKHGTYPFDPDGLPLIPWYIIFPVYEDIERLYLWGYISDFEYFALRFQADTLFFDCVVERFSEQGGRFAFLRINVGEPGAHMNGAQFINAGALRAKLEKPF